MKNSNQYVIRLAPTEPFDYVNDSSVFNTIIGQEEVKKKLVFFVKSHSDVMPIPTFLFTGSQGLGKSFMANKIAVATGRDIVEVNCGTVSTSKDFVERILFEKVAGSTPKTIFLDEAHKLTPEISTFLLTMLNPNEENVNRVAYGNLMVEYDFVKINTILATTDAYKIFRPLLNRCVEVYFNLYENNDLYNILRKYLPDIDLACNVDDIAYACRGRARDAFILSQNIKRYCSMTKKIVFEEGDWNEVKIVFGIHDLGLNSQEIRLMSEVADSQPVSSTNIAIKLGVSVQNVESELELRPRELGLIENTARGRILTDKGVAYLSGVK